MKRIETEAFVEGTSLEQLASTQVSGCLQVVIKSDVLIPSHAL